MKIEGEPGKKFHVYAEGSNGLPIAPPQASYDTIDEVMNHPRNLGRKYMVSVQRKTMRWHEFEEWAKGQASDLSQEGR